MAELLKKSEWFDPALGNCQNYRSCRNGRFCQAASVVSLVPPGFKHPCSHPQLQQALDKISETGGEPSNG